MGICGEGYYELVSLEKNCDEIENDIINNLSSHLYCLSGFSMGATMAVEIIGRGNVDVTKTHLDAAFLIHARNPSLTGA